MNNKIVKNSVIVMILTLGSKILGFLREVLLSYFFGASDVTDAYIVSLSIYTLLLTGMTLSLTTSYVQIFSSQIEEERQNSLTTLLLKYSSIIIITISVFCVVFSDIIIIIFASGFSEETTHITKMLLHIQLPFAFLTAIQYILGAFLRTKNIFWVGGSCLLIANIINIISIILSSNNGYIILGIGAAISAVLCSVWTLAIATKSGFRFKKANGLKYSDITPFITLATPIFFGQLIQQLNVIVDKNFASMVDVGILSSINYANKVNILFSTFFVASITTVLFPALSKISISDKGEFNKISIKASKIVTMLAFPVATGMAILAPEIIEILFMRGEFTAENAVITSEILMIYAVGIPALSLIEILNKQFYAMGNTKTPVKLSVLTLSVNIILNFIWVRSLGHIGLALSTTISVTLLCLLLNIFFKRNYGLDIIAENKCGLFKIVVSSVVMGAGVLALKSLTLGLSSLIVLIISAVVGVVIYFVILSLLKDEDLKEMYKKLAWKVSKTNDELN